MYQESYFNFCARLMEQEGLIWTHRFEKDKHVLAIGDSDPASFSRTATHAAIKLAS
jgi:type VI secretion system secreted protein VgrG